VVIGMNKDKNWTNEEVKEVSDKIKNLILERDIK
jgi:hypothetical protein